MFVESQKTFLQSVQVIHDARTRVAPVTNGWASTTAGHDARTHNGDRHVERPIRLIVGILMDTHPWLASDPCRLHRCQVEHEGDLRGLCSGLRNSGQHYSTN